MPQTYFFMLGRTPELSLLELQKVSGQTPVEILLNKVVALSFKDDEAAKLFFNTLGGSLKVMRHDGEFQLLSEEDLPKYMTAYLAQFPKLEFAVAEFGRENIPKLDLHSLKKALREQKISSRFIEAPREGLSAAVLLHHPEIVELNVIQTETHTFFARTIAIQDIDDWTRRDRGKPYANRKKGMLPPKLARVMVNVALAELGSESPQNEVTVYDPFCGTGTVLLEARMRGTKVVGSDLDVDAIEGTIKNLTWLEKNYQLSNEVVGVMKSDVANAKLPGKMHVDAIVSEPFLGKPTPNVAELENIFRGLEKMYLGAFKHWTTLLRPNGVVLIVFPFVQAGKRAFSLEKMIDKLKQFGYTAALEPVMYHRPQAVIQRQIWIFRLEK